jgi:hypothetical protein
MSTRSRVITVGGDYKDADSLAACGRRVIRQIALNLLHGAV